MERVGGLMDESRKAGWTVLGSRVDVDSFRSSILHEAKRAVLAHEILGVVQNLDRLGRQARGVDVEALRRPTVERRVENPLMSSTGIVQDS